MSNRYRVVATLVSGNNEPAEIVWSGDVDALGVTLAVAQLLGHDVPDSSMPESIQTRLVSITVTAI